MIYHVLVFQKENINTNEEREVKRKNQKRIIKKELINFSKSNSMQEKGEGDINIFFCKYWIVKIYSDF